jgi:hypothetical protein
LHWGNIKLPLLVFSSACTENGPIIVASTGTVMINNLRKSGIPPGKGFTLERYAAPGKKFQVCPLKTSDSHDSKGGEWRGATEREARERAGNR